MDPGLTAEVSDKKIFPDTFHRASAGAHQQSGLKEQ